MGAHGWVAGIASHGSVSLSRGWLISVEAPRHPGHLSFIQLDAVVNFKIHVIFYMPLYIISGGDRQVKFQTVLKYHRFVYAITREI